jgi:ketosteroid isomerase-like protein
MKEEMKRALWILLLCPVAYAAPCPVGQAKDEATLVEMEHTWARTVEARDVSGLSCILADEFEEAGPTGGLTERASMLARVGDHGVHYELSELHALVYGDFGFVRGVGMVARDHGRLKIKTRFTDIFVYRDGRWQCVAGHESVFPLAAH